MATQPGYSDYLQYSPTFKWGGQTWSAADRGRFEKLLRSKGVNPSKFYRNHPVAAKTFDPVEGQIYGMIQPQLTGINAERTRTADLWNRRMQNLTGFAAALMPYLQGVPGAIQAPYRSGADAVQSAGSGYGGRLNVDSAAEAAGANSVLNSIGAPAGQQLSGGDAGSVLAGMGGMEADLMRASGGAYGAAAAQLPKTATLEAQLKMNDLLSGAAEADKGFSTDILQVLQGLPAARMTLQGNQAKITMAQQKIKLDQLNKDREFWLKKQAYYQATGRLKLAQEAGQRAAQAEKRYENESAGRDYWGNVMPKYKELPDGTIVPRYAPKSGRKGSTASTVPGTPAYNARAVANVGKAQKDIARDVDTFMKSIGATDAPPKSTKGYASLKRDLWQKYRYLATTPTAKKRLRAAIELAVKSWRPKSAPGAGGAGGTIVIPPAGG